jgi:hypothetical protein
MPHRSSHSAADSQPDQDTAAVQWFEAGLRLSVRGTGICALSVRGTGICAGSVVSWGWSLSWFVHATVPASSLLIRLDYLLKVSTLQ